MPSLFSGHFYKLRSANTKLKGVMTWNITIISVAKLSYIIPTTEHALCQICEAIPWP